MLSLYHILITAIVVVGAMGNFLISGEFIIIMLVRSSSTTKYTVKKYKGVVVFVENCSKMYSTFLSYVRTS